MCVEITIRDGRSTAENIQRKMFKSLAVDANAFLGNYTGSLSPSSIRDLLRGEK